MNAPVPKADARRAYPAPARPREPAHVIRSGAEAIAAAQALAPCLAEEAGERDRDRRLPAGELDLFSQSGLWGISVPQAYGGAGVSQGVIAKVFQTIAAADASIAQIPQNHFEILDVIRATGSEAQKRELFGLVLAGLRLGNAFSEFKGKNVEDFQTRLVRRGKGFVINGEKFYSTGALFAHLVPVVAIDEDGKVQVAIVDRETPGLEVIDDWSGFGQRTTASGTVRLHEVAVPPERVLPAHLVYDVPSPAGPQSQLVHASIDAGIAQSAIETTIRLVREHARPWIDSGKERAGDDPYTIAQIGDLEIRLHAAEALLERAAGFVDEAIADPTPEPVARAKIAVAEAKVLTTEIALLGANKLFELAGTRSTLAAHQLDRLWRDARTHTLHDPVRWKFHAIGRYYLDHVHPPIHSWI
ncbi:MAG: SfnB family sulfur acquisition oxidoreductase [Dongiaceae bacterium]